MKWYWWVAIAAAVAVIIVLYAFRSRQSAAISEVDARINSIDNNNMNNGTKPFDITDAAAALQVVANKYGKATAAQIEKVARLETAHFTSKQYKATGTGGMEADGPAPYYGWYSPFFIANPDYTPVGTTDMLEGKGASEIGGNPQSGTAKVFVIMPSVEAWMMFLADYAQRHANQGGILHWYSDNAAQQQIYAQAIKNISTPLTNQLA